MSRLQAIKRISHLQDKQCKSCERNREETHKNFNPNDFCGGCDVYAELRSLGNRLTSISDERRKQKGVQIKKNRKTPVVLMDEKEYMQLKRKSVTEANIAQEKGITTNRLGTWRKENLSEQSQKELKEIVARMKSKSASKRHKKRRDLFKKNGDANKSGREKV